MFSSAYVWAKVLGYMEEQLGAVTISTWFDDAEVVELTEEHLILYSPSDFRRDIIRKRCADYVQEALKQQGLYLKIWDGFRPVSAQFKLWEVYPDPTYVANPNNGFSSHSRGNTVDITLVYADGTELVMPTEFDVFSRLADRDYSDCSPETAENALLLEELMIMHGFKPYSGEWWHFSDSQSYPVEEVFEPVTAAAYYADCQEYISLRAKPSSTSDMVTRIPAGAQFQIRAKYGDFALVSYNDLWGYVLREYIQPVYQNDTPQM
jgi:D-alanyl-D-alanine dipeptidase